MAANRRTPGVDEVAEALDTVTRATRRLVAYQGDMDRAVKAAYDHDPRPSYRQISDAIKAGGREMSPDAVRALIHGRRPSKKEQAG